MKIAWSNMKGACLLLLGLLAAGNERSFAADIMSTSFNKLADDQGDMPTVGAGAASTANVGSASTSPFKDEAPNPPASSSVPGVYSTSGPCCGNCCPGDCCNDNCCDGCCCDPQRFWFRGEYMQWWTSGSHVPPLVSTVTNLNDPAGSLATVFGNRDIRDGDHDGYRIDLGMWLDNCHKWAIEADYFDFQGRPDDYDSGFTGGYQNGTVFPIVRGFFQPAVGVNVNAVGYPSQYVGRTTVDTNDFFQSAGIWARRSLLSSECAGNCNGGLWGCGVQAFHMDALLGYRFTRLIDYVNVRDDEVNINSADPNYLTIFTNVDNFHAANTFNGFEMGLDTEVSRGRWSLDLLGKLAIGVNTQDVQEYGLVQTDASETGGTISRAAATEEVVVNRFSWMPELTATLGFQLNDHLKFTAAYDIMYWSAVARAGNQILAEPTTGLPYGPQPTLTPSTINESYFWAEGFRVGAVVSY